MVSFTFWAALPAWAQAPADLALAVLSQARQALLDQHILRPAAATLDAAAWRALGRPPERGWERFAVAFRACTQGQPARVSALGERVLRAMVDSVGDPYSTVLTASDLAAEEALRQKGTLAGIGVELAWRQGLVVVSTLEGSPARQAGLRPGDRIAAVDGRSLRGLSFYQAGSLLSGPPGSLVRLTVVRQGQTLKASLRRQTLHLPPVAQRLLDGDTGYLRVGYFGPRTAAEAADALARLQASGARGLVLDLRGNPGGDYDQGLKTAALFVRGTLVHEETRAGSRPLVSHSACAWRGPVVVLVDRGTASSAEIVALALKGRVGVRLVGERTFGKALVQTTYALAGGGALRLSTGRYRGAGGEQVEGRGVPPDVAGGADPLARARRVLRSVLLLEQGAQPVEVEHPDLPALLLDQAAGPQLGGLAADGLAAGGKKSAQDAVVHGRGQKDAASVRATLLLGQVHQHRGQALAHGHQGQLLDFLVGLAQPFGEEGQKAPHRGRRAVEHLEKVGTPQHKGFAGLGRVGRGGAGVAVEERHVPEKAALAQHRQGHFAA
ncbi:MAG TPA: S41 family peptidase [Candidatus Nitrosotenuis sp.]|nr:S41 family peptidase [Candidatus Nitrosotenuis sp.]